MSVLYKHIIQVENEHVGLKVCVWHKHTIAPPPPQSTMWGTCPAPLPPINKVGHMPPTPHLRQ